MESNENYYEGINHIVEVSSESGNFAEEVNRCIRDRGYKILHIGTKTTVGPKDMPFHYNVAILGKKLTEEEASRLGKISEKFRPAAPLAGKAKLNLSGSPPLDSAKIVKQIAAQEDEE